MTTVPYTDPAFGIEERVADLLGRMHLDEKLAQLGAVNVADLLTDQRFDEDTALVVIPHGIGQVTRIGAMTGLEPQQSAELFNQVQRLAVEHTRLGIPVMVHEESLAGYCARGATVFPQSLALACSWDPELVKAVAARIRDQLLAVGARHSLAPVLDVARDPRWGRVEETYGEDPVLVGALGAAYVQGMQGEDLTKAVLATGKHFLAHGISEGGRNRAPVQLGARELREVYAEPFAAAIRESGLASVMSSYHCIDGLPGSGSREILTDLLRDELGFDGIVVADYFAVSLLMTDHRVAGDREDAAIAAITAGLDIELPALDCFGDPLKSALRAGRVSMSVLDQAVRRVLSIKMHLGLFESPYVDSGRAHLAFSDPDSSALAHRAAIRGLVLLANDGVLPMSTELARLAVIGPAADDRRLLQGDYHYPAHQELFIGRDGDGVSEGGSRALPEDVYLPSGRGSFKPGPYYVDHVTPLAGLRSALPPSVEITYEKGCEVTGDDRSGIPAAAAAAARSELAVVVVGGRSGLDPTSTVGEARDASDLRLTGVQEELVKSVAGTGTPMVLVVMSGRVHALGAVAPYARGLLVAWPLGEQGGRALADVLLGREEPVGRLAVTLPRVTGQVPLHSSHRSGGARSAFYGEYSDCPGDPLFAFGHGLSYTSFDYADLDVDARDTASLVFAAVTVTNTGARRGEDAVQLYVSDLVASVARPETYLVGFARLDLDPGESARVTFQVHPSRLAFYDRHMRFAVEPGSFRFAVGASSSDLRQQAVVELGGPVNFYSQRSIVAVSSTVSKLRPTEAGR